MKLNYSNGGNGQVKGVVNTERQLCKVRRISAKMEISCYMTAHFIWKKSNTAID